MSAGTGWHGFVCPDGPFASSPVGNGANAERVNGVPPTDDFIKDPQDLIIIEGPVWIGDALYVSEIENGPQFGGGFGGPGGGGSGMSKAAPAGRVLKVTTAGAVSVLAPDVGSNGLAVDPSGKLVACSHKLGGILRIDLSSGSSSDWVTSYMNARFDSPNDLAFGRDGTLYFSDPDYQAPSPVPQAKTGAYRVAPGGSSATPIAEGKQQPNGITLSPDGSKLYLSASDGVYVYPVMADGSLGSGTRFGNASSDGMAIDCAGNLYTAANQNVTVLDPTGKELARISVGSVQSVSNIAFGGADHKTLYITALGASGQAGLFKLQAAVPGFPY